MPQTHSFTSQTVLLKFLILCLLWHHLDAQVDREDNIPPGGRRSDGGAFFALQSCHQLLSANKGEFFSPDYLCTNPPLWCNWTIQVDPGKRIHLQLEDLTSDSTCYLKQDQIHVDEPDGHFGGHKILQKCWRKAKFTSSSSTLYVVLLIGGWPNQPYRGFSGRYQAFGQPVVRNPQEGFTDRGRKPSAGLEPFREVEPEQDYYDQASAPTDEVTWEEDEVSESHVHPPAAVPTVAASTRRTSWSGRIVSHVTSHPLDTALHAASPQQHNHNQNHELKPAAHNPSARRRNVDEASAPAEMDAVPETNTQSKRGEVESADGENGRAVGQVSEESPSLSEGPDPEETEQAQPNMVELLKDPTGTYHLFEVAIEVDFTQDLEQTWDNQARSLLLSVKSLVREQLEALHTHLVMSSKRIKRLNAGVLYILWLQIGHGPGGPHVHKAVRSALHGLIAKDVSLREDHGKAVVTSVSTADVNECGTQLLLCDVNADCVNQFGSYSCRCRTGFEDKSRLGSGGTVCVDMKAAGCSSGLSPETKGVYVLFFLLSSFILMLLVGAGVLYHCRHRGAFLVRCNSSGSSIAPPDLNNNNHHHHRQDVCYTCPAESNPPAPPPPARGPRRGWPQGKETCPPVDLPLLRFSSLLPPDDYVEPQEGGKM
ncbi:hypothetical protein EXN66_Car003808 [Channa argus]|uniref:CUB domain-containing protein n=1 Tax=Channa argus TaxID=215402 RepID=A0A6G1PDN1_CHAAH|nr:hypothetical protein EXN66_Car003808 [Channa argus]